MVRSACDGGSKGEEFPYFRPRGEGLNFLHQGRTEFDGETEAVEPCF